MTSQQLIDGIVPDRVERPTSAEDISAVLTSLGDDEWLMPLGGGTAMSGANPVDRIPVALDMSGFAAITDYEPADLTVSVGAGTRWKTLRDALREQGQTIPLDVPLPEQATVGGVVATAYAGPRRLRDGTLKDLLLGASFVRGDGLVAKAGGMVVKNVSGFEITRLLHGSWGSLAVITSANLKVIPMHEFDLTLQSERVDTLTATEKVLSLTRARSAIAAATIDGTLEQGTVSARLTGREGPTRELASEIMNEGEILWSGEIEASEDWWQQRENRLATDEPQRVAIEIGCQPSEILSVVSTLRVALPDTGAVELQVSPGAGAIRLGIDAGMLSLDAWTRIWREHGLERSARYVVASAPRAWRADQDVWMIPTGPRKLMQSLKTAFDPDDHLNRGRLWTAPLASRA